MHHNTLGRTGLRVSVAGLGTGGFSRMGLKSGKSEQEAARLIEEAVALGINFIDTAPSYRPLGRGGRVLKTTPRNIIACQPVGLIDNTPACCYFLQHEGRAADRRTARARCRHVR